jgi:hypothetical protein
VIETGDGVYAEEVEAEVDDGDIEVWVEEPVKEL